MAFDFFFCCPFSCLSINDNVSHKPSCDLPKSPFTLCASTTLFLIVGVPPPLFVPLHKALLLVTVWNVELVRDQETEKAVCVCGGGDVRRRFLQAAASLHTSWRGVNWNENVISLRLKTSAFLLPPLSLIVLPRRAFKKTHSPAFLQGLKGIIWCFGQLAKKVGWENWHY